MYQLGKEFYADAASQKKGRELLHQAAKAGSAEALQCKLGKINFEGQPAVWDQKAADQGYARAFGRLGILYKNGAGGITKHLLAARQGCKEAREKAKTLGIEDLI